jgi:hypothetical protein
MTSPAANGAFVGVVAAGHVARFVGYKLLGPGLCGIFMNTFSGQHTDAGLEAALAVPADKPLRIKLVTNVIPYHLYFAIGEGDWLLTSGSLPAADYFFAACLHTDTRSLALGTCPA